MKTRTKKIGISHRCIHPGALATFRQLVGPLFARLASENAGDIHAIMQTSLSMALVEAALKATEGNQVHAARLPAATLLSCVLAAPAQAQFEETNHRKVTLPVVDVEGASGSAEVTIWFCTETPGAYVAWVKPDATAGCPADFVAVWWVDGAYTIMPLEEYKKFCNAAEVLPRRILWWNEGFKNQEGGWITLVRASDLVAAARAVMSNVNRKVWFDLASVKYWPLPRHVPDWHISF